MREDKFNIELLLSMIFGNNASTTFPVFFYSLKEDEQFPKEILDEKQTILNKEKELKILIDSQKFEECVTLRDEIKKLKESFDVTLSGIASKKEERRKLQWNLDLAIKEERYEDAVKFRDQLKNFSNENS